ncbi:3-oxoacyl-ACP synthase III family protein [Amycolatopsis thermophila]|uniref:3-oxoacyl-[acyl-carrier-protein] synthase-3 n=1 Tax=Amycolatopsis thermophila TaxID=206084 RepID=A0ABU0ELA8_9PSEU|nr:ketoacyl-ACP synthase III [Amycolatopsis thermophila]MDQ0376062.1 3-oxoacyl-[acyl-carrier-protein] synthase-3 [Amycolatopsis thermophila]
MSTDVGIIGLGRYLPSEMRTNEDVAARTPGVNAEWVGRRTGVLSRFVAAPGEAASDLAAPAAEAALSAAGLDAAQVDLLVVATTTADEPSPATACRVQAALGAADAVSFDVNGACAGWLFAVKIARDWLRDKPGSGYAVVIGVEVFSRFLDPDDRATAVIFGDGAAAAVLGPVPEGTGFDDIRLGTESALADAVIVPGGGSRLPASTSTVERREHTIRMDGRAVTQFFRSRFPQLLYGLLDDHDLKLGDIDAFACHQANPVLLKAVAAEHGVDPGRLIVVADRIGNIGSGCTPYAIAEAVARDLLQPGSRVILVAFGAGMTFGGALLTWAPGVKLLDATKENL